MLRFSYGNLQMPVSGANLLCFGCPLTVEKNREDFWYGMRKINLVMISKWSNCHLTRFLFFSNYWEDYAIQLVKSLGSYPTKYSQVFAIHFKS
jgi:hypothetical protein